jgi:hypothetical protein
VLFRSFICFFTEVTFMAAYETAFQSSGSHEAGLRAAMDVFKGRAPFNVLTQGDLDRALAVFSRIPDARWAAKLVRHLDRKRDASLLANQTFLSQLETEYRNTHNV